MNWSRNLRFRRTCSLGQRILLPLTKICSGSSVCNNSRFQVSRNISGFHICRPQWFWVFWVCPGLAQWLTVCASSPESKSPHTREVSWGDSGDLPSQKLWNVVGLKSSRETTWLLSSSFSIPAFPLSNNTHGVWRRQQKRTQLGGLREQWPGWG